MRTLSELRPGDDIFIDIYHEILKHELCLMRLGDLCFNLNGYYVSRSRQSIVQNLDVKLTVLDIIYAVLNSSIFRGIGYRFNAEDFERFIGGLVESRLLVDLPCSEEAQLMLKALDESPLIEVRLGDNPFIYYYMVNQLKRRKEDFEEIEKYLRSHSNRCFKTAYGELIRLLRYEVALPRSVLDTPYRVLESYVLPFIEEYLPQRRPEKLDEICGALTSTYGNNGEVICRGLRGIGISGLDDYQAAMIKRLIDNFNKPKIAVISAPTGSGKTLIFMIYVLLKLLKFGGVAVIIYPTKALAREQLEFMINILYLINVVSAKKIRAYILDGDSPHSIRELKNRPFRGGIKVRGGTLYYDNEGRIKLVRDSSADESIDWVSEIRPQRIEGPAVVITNHAMLSLHLNKGSPWVKDLLNKLNTIVIDEAHVYLNDIELLNTLHFLITRLFVAALITDALSKNREIRELTVLEGIKELISGKRIDLILSSATLGDRKIIEEGLSIGQLGGVDLAAIRGNQEPNLKPLLKWLLGVYGEDSKIYTPFYSVITRDSARRRLVITVINFPMPSRSAQAPFIEGLASAIIWSEALSRGLGRAYGVSNEFHVLAFIDNKLTQREVFNRLIRRGIKQEAFHADKLLVSPLMDLNTHGREVIEEALRGCNDPLTDPYLSTYSHLQLFYKYDVLREYVKLYNEGKADVKRLRNLVHDAIEFAKLVYEAHVDGVKYLNRTNNVHYVMLHNADLEMSDRSYVENVLRNGRWRLTIATSTLELGVNIPGVAMVIQYGSPPSSESFIQRIGRAGRESSSLRISFGVLFMKSVGKDISYIDETQAFKSLFNLEQPKYSEKPDRETLTRYMSLLYGDLGSDIEINKVKTILSKVLQELYSINDSEVKSIVNEVQDLINNHQEIQRRLPTGTQESGIHSFRILIEHTINGLSRAYTNLQNATSLLKNASATNKVLLDIVNSIEDIANRIRELYNGIESIPISKLLTIELIKKIQELKKISEDIMNLINNINSVVGQSPYYKYKLKSAIDSLNSAIANINNAYNAFLRSISAITIANYQSERVRRRLQNSVTNLIMGNRLPNPAISESITGIVLTCGDASLEGSSVKLLCNQRDASRDEVLRTLPFKYYE